MTDREYELARHVAATADAWLTDPRDGALYQRLVDAVLAWRSYAMPTLDGLQNADRPTTAELAAAADAVTAVHGNAAVPAREADRQPVRLAGVASDVMAALRASAVGASNQPEDDPPST